MDSICKAYLQVEKKNDQDKKKNSICGNHLRDEHEDKANYKRSEQRKWGTDAMNNNK